MPPDCTSPTTDPGGASLLDDRLRTAHELRTIVQSLRLVAEQLAGTELTDEQHRLHGALTATIRDAESLIATAGIRSRAGVESGDGRMDGREGMACAADVVREVIAMADNRARHKGIALDARLPAAIIDLSPKMASILRLCARNLISNAITHTDHGSVTVNLTRGDMMELTVTDTGSGIAPEDLPYIFESGYRAGGNESATDGGFGLAIVREAVLGVRGEVSVVESSVHGTRFIVRLPKLKAKRKSCAEGRGKVLIADDSASIRELLAMIVTTGGYDALVAADGAEAVALAADEGFAAVILDQNMPSLSGAEAAARIIADADRRGAPRPALIALSGDEGGASNSGESPWEAEGGLWQERWHKPIGRDAILAGLERVLLGASRD